MLRKTEEYTRTTDVASPSFRATLLSAVLSVLIVSFFVLGPNPAVAQDRIEIRAADTSSPRDTLRSFIDGCNEVFKLVRREKYFDRDAPEHAHVGMRILDCLDVSELPAFALEQRAGEVAVCIKEILDREELPPWSEIPDEDAILAAGGFEKLSQWRVPGTRITIVRVEEGPQRHEYLFSTGTVSRAVEYFKQVKSKPYRTEGPEVSKGLYQWFVSTPGDPTLGAIVSRLPEWMQRGRIHGMTVWKWPGLLVALLIALTLLAVTYRVFAYLTRRVRDKSVFKYCLTIVFPILGVLIPLTFLYICDHYLTIRGTPLYIISFSSTSVALLAGLFVLFAANSRIAETIISSPRINPHGLNAQLIRIVSRLFGLAASVILVLVGGQYLGIPITTLLASAGIGGLAIALGAQDTLKSLFGTLTLLADKPFRVGDRIIFEKYDGVIEDIGLRSTQLRLLTGHLVTLPNDQLARSDIENVGRRPYIRRNAEIHIPLDTPCERVEKAVEIIRDKLNNHEGMDANYPPRVFFNDFGSDAFSVQFVYWYTPPNYWDFKAFNEDLNFQIFRAFEEQGIQFSLPSRHTYWKEDR